MTRWSGNGFTTLATLCFAAVSVLGGCTTTTERQLWHQNTELQQRLDRAYDENARLSRELADLRSELERAKAELGAAREQGQRGQADRPAEGPLGDFEGIRGVDTQRDGDEVTVRVPGDILFAPGRASLNDAARRTLSEVADVLQRRYPRGTIRVVGHTDSDPIRATADRWRDNHHLSQARAQTVRDYLSERGVPGNRMRVVGRGPDEPVASNESAAGKARNRRVEIIVQKQ